MRWRIPLLGLVLLLVGGELSAQDVCPVQGVWQLESMAWDGEALEVEDYMQIKLVTGSYFAWQGAQQVADTLENHVGRYGGGTYRVTATTYTESVDYFFDPGLIGQEIAFSCRVEGDLWYHEGDIPMMKGDEQTGSLHIAEVWHRIK
jgi:hypothetical protein